MNCPRCKTAITTPVNPDGIIRCPGCGARLMTRSAARGSAGDPRSVAGDAASAPVIAPAPASADAHPPDVTAPSGLDFKVRVGRPAHRERLEPKEGYESETITLEMLHLEILALQTLQHEMLDLLQQLAQGAPQPAPGQSEGEAGPVLSPVRSQPRKSVLLVDDDAETRTAAKAALEQADVPVRVIDNGTAAVQEIAADKPDVIVIELGISGEMGGKDVINMIKATMEWVDIPIVLWTREAVDSQKEARQIHGADEIVRKASGAEALVARVITLFRRT